MRCYGCMGEKGEEKVCPHCGYKEETQEPFFLKPGTVLKERYMIGKELGNGGFGITYIGWDNYLKRKIAVKEYYPRNYATRNEGNTQVSIYSGEGGEIYRSGLDSFMNEAQRIAQFTHIKGVVQVYDYFQDNNTGYIVMEYVEWNTIKTILKSEKTLTYPDASDIVISVLQTLEDVHETGIIHRDLSPDNIFAKKFDDGRWETKLIDFGAARLAISEHTQNFTVILKRGYAPVEQYNPNKQGPWTDIYAVGATFYRMITGHVPCDAMERVQKDELLPPSKYKIKITSEQEKVLLTSMEIKPEKRYSSAKAFKEDLIKVKKQKNTSFTRNVILGGIGVSLFVLSTIFAFSNITTRTNKIEDNVAQKREVANEEYIEKTESETQSVGIESETRIIETEREIKPVETESETKLVETESKEDILSESLEEKEEYEVSVRESSNDLSGYLGKPFSAIMTEVTDLVNIKDISGEVKWANSDISITGTSESNIVRIHYQFSSKYNADGIYIGLDESTAKDILLENWIYEGSNSDDWQIYIKQKFKLALRYKDSKVSDLYIAIADYLPVKIEYKSKISQERGDVIEKNIPIGNDDLSVYINHPFSSILDHVPDLNKTKDELSEVKYENNALSVTGTSDSNIVRIHFITGSTYSADGIFLGMSKDNVQQKLGNKWKYLGNNVEGWFVYSCNNMKMAIKYNDEKVSDLYLADSDYITVKIN